MKNLLTTLAYRLESTQPTSMVTVIASSGSVPRGPGARMLVGEGGYIAGTVGGGTIEHEAIILAQAHLVPGETFTRTFSLSNAAAANLGMVCGGEVTLLFQALRPADAAFYRGALVASEPAYLLTDTRTGHTTISPEPVHQDGFFAQRIDAPGTAYIFGGGHVARALAPVLTSAEFRVAVLDDRPEFANAQAFPFADEVRVVDFNDLESVHVGPEDYALIMTRGHEHDLNILRAMLSTPARYIGMMGSRAKRAFVYDHLMAEGFSAHDFERVHSPIGLPIAAETPFEIAISIAAELIKVRADKGE